MNRAEKNALAEQLLAKIEKLRAGPAKAVEAGERYEAELASKYGDTHPCVVGSKYPYIVGALEEMVKNSVLEIEALVRAHLLPTRRGRGRR